MGHTYAVADLHGRWDLWTQIKNFLHPDDTLYVLGDCADRGENGWMIIQDVWRDPRCIYLKGNHEDLFCESMSGDLSLHFYNGGQPTYDAWEQAGANESWIKILDNLPVEKIYMNKRGQRVSLTHAGYTPHCNQSNRSYIEDPWRLYSKHHRKIGRENDLLWDRDHFNDMWDVDFVDTIIVHGHTPIPYMGEYLYGAPRDEEVKPGAFWYSPDDRGVNHKVNIDSGAFFTGLATVIDLDTWEEHLFKGDDCVYEE